MNRFIAIVALLSFAAFGDDTSPVTKTRLGSLNPREGLVVTGVNFSTNNEALVETIETIGGRATAPDLSALTNYTDYVAQHIRTNESLRSFVKEDGTVYHWITNGIWSTVNLHGNGWDDSYLAGARLYLWWENGVTNWTWYITGGPMAQSRTIAAAADAEVLQFKYSNGKTNVFVRGGALMYAENVGGMVSSRFNAASHITTNDVCAVVTNAVVVGYGEWRTSLYYGGDWRILSQNEPAAGNWIFSFTNIETSAVVEDVHVYENPEIAEYVAIVDGNNLPLVRDYTIKNTLGLARLSDLPPLTNGLVSVETDPTIAEWAKAANPPAYTAYDVGAYPAADGFSLANIVNAWEGYWGGTNVIFEVTNYYGNTSGEFPRLRIKELREGSWQTVWDEANKFDACASQIVAVVALSNAALKADIAEDYAPKAWGAYTDKGATNVVGNSVWMTSPETYFAGGTEYQRVAVGSGAVCVLVDNGAGTYTAGEAGTFRFQDEGGTNYFGFAKSDSYTIGCRTDGITVDGNLVTLRYDVIMGGTDVPVVYWRLSLGSGEWTQLNNADGTAVSGAPYTVTWYQSGGSYYAAINCGSNPSGFFKAETSVAGDVVFETNMKVRLGGGIECTNTTTGVMGVIRPSYNGSTVTWSWSAR